MRNFLNFGNLPLEELARLPVFYLPTVAPDLSKIAFYWNRSGQLELYVMDNTPGATPRQISQGQLPKTPYAGYAWSKDGNTIYFAKDNNGDEQHNVWCIDLTSGAAEQLTNNPQAQEYPFVVSPDGRTLYVMSNMNGQMNLFALDLETRTYTQLTEYANPVFRASLSDDGKQFAYVTNETEATTNQDIYLMDADGSNKRRIVHISDQSKDSSADWSSDGRYLAVQSDASGSSRSGVYELEKGTLRWLTPEGKEYSAGKFSPDAKRLIAYRNEDSTQEVVVYDVESGTPVVTELPPGLSFDADWLDNERFMVNIMTDVRRAELRDYHLHDGASSVLLPADYGSINPDFFTPHEYVWYPSTDKTPIPAILYRPKAMEAGKQYPAILHIHGGPTGQFFRSFDTTAQYLADLGFVVLMPNIRGSTGYGVDFRDACIKDWGGRDLEDVQGGVAYLKSLPEIDPARIGIMGGSYGGYMTYMAMTKKPHLWKAGVAMVGITDLHALYNSSMEHFKYYLQAQMGDPVADAELWRERSAVNFAEQMTGKLLILHGLNDPRCPIEQARLFRDRLLEVGKIEGQDFEYVELADEGHGSADIEQKTRVLNLISEFMRRAL